MYEQLTEDQKKVLALTEILRTLSLPKDQLETYIITLLMWIYKDDDRKVLMRIESMGKLRDSLNAR